MKTNKIKEQADWGLSGTIIWIYLRDISFLEENWTYLSDNNHFSACLADAISLKGERESAYPKKTGRAINGLEIYEEAPNYEPAIKELTEALRLGNIEAFGMKNEISSRILPSECAHIEIEYLSSPIHAVSGKEEWFDIKLKRADILKLWPEELMNAEDDKDAQKILLPNTEKATKVRKTPWIEDARKAISNLKKKGISPSATDILRETITDNPDNYPNIVKEDKNTDKEKIVWIKKASGIDSTILYGSFSQKISRIKTGKV